MLWLLLLAWLPLCAQSFELAPKNWAGCGVEYSSRAGVFCSLASKVSSQGVYSYSTYDVQRVKGSPPITSPRTGLALALRSFQLGSQATLYILGLATVGATETTTAVVGSFAGGGVALLQWKQWTVHVGLRQSTGPAAGMLVELGTGFAW